MDERVRLWRRAWTSAALLTLAILCLGVVFDLYQYHAARYEVVFTQGGPGWGRDHSVPVPRGDDAAMQMQARVVATGATGQVRPEPLSRFLVYEGMLLALGLSALIAGLYVWPNTVEYRTYFAYSTVLVGFTAFVMCDGFHVCMEGHLGHTPYPPLFLAVDACWIILLPISVMFLLRVNLLMAVLWGTVLGPLMYFRLTWGGILLENLLLVPFAWIAYRDLKRMPRPAKS